MNWRNVVKVVLAILGLLLLTQVDYIRYRREVVQLQVRGDYTLTETYVVAWDRLTGAIVRVDRILN